jgi:hypothetical protein
MQSGVLLHLGTVLHAVSGLAYNAEAGTQGKAALADSALSSEDLSR